MIKAKVYFAATALLLMGAAEGAAQTTFECKPPKSKVVASSIGKITSVSVPDYAELFGTGLGTTITQGSGDCVVVEISALVGSSNPAIVAPEIRVLLDNTPSSFPAKVIWPALGASSANFIFPKVAAGTHRVRVQFAVPAGRPSTTRALVQHYNVIIHHAPPL